MTRSAAVRVAADDGPATPPAGQTPGRPIRILHITTTIGTGGAERMLLNVIADGDPAQFRHGVLALRRGGMLEEPLRQAGAEVWNCDLKAGDLSLSAAFKVRRILAEFRPDVIQGWMYHGNLAACLARTLGRKVPIVWGMHHTIDDIDNEKRLTRVLIRLGRRLSTWPERIVYVSRVSRKQHVALGYADEAALTIPNGFDCERFRPNPDARKTLRRSLGLAEDAPLLAKAAVVRPMKDHGNLMRAAALLKRRGLDFTLLVLGQRATEDNAELMRLIEEADIGDRVRLLGERHDMPDIFAGLDGLVVSSAWGEAFPIVLGEAMAAGVPCVTTDVGDSAYMVGDTGMVVPPRNAEALADAMATLLGKDIEERRALGARARARIRENFALADVSRRYYDIYRELAPGPQKLRAV
jgi:glycosyltransferase involved in cell wall biosynthesis